MLYKSVSFIKFLRIFCIYDEICVNIASSKRVNKHSENTGKIRYLLDLVYFLSNVLSTKLYGNEPVVARYTMEDANCTLTEPLRLVESLSGSSCDKE